MDTFINDPKLCTPEEIESIDLALDLGARMGWCIRTNNGTYVSGCRDFTRKSDDTRYSKLNKIRRWLEQIHEHFPIANIYYEEVTFSTNTYADQAHGAYKGVLHQFAEIHEIPIEGFPVPTVKKSLTGRGNASKQGMIYYAEKYVGKEITDDNEADAIGVMHTGRNGRK